MRIGLAALNTLPDAEAAQLLLSCCGSSRWVSGMLAERPFESRDAVLAAAERIAQGLDRDDWMEAFSHHPRIGERSGAAPMSGREAVWSAGEQAGMDVAGEGVRNALAAANHRYEERFGYRYLVCAAGKTAEEMLTLVRTRLTNDADAELAVASGEQRKITRLRLEKLLQ